MKAHQKYKCSYLGPFESTNSSARIQPTEHLRFCSQMSVNCMKLTKSLSDKWTNRSSQPNEFGKKAKNRRGDGALSSFQLTTQME